MSSDKVIILTGASSGIGAGVAVHLVEIGYRKLTLVARRKERLDQVAKLCKEKVTEKGEGQVDILVIAEDLMTEKGCQRVIQDAAKHFGGIDVLISNAGGAFGLADVKDELFENFQKTFQLNLMAPFLLTKLVLPYLEERKGNIVYVSSVSSTKPYPGVASYCSSKAALDQFARVVALEEAPKGVRVNVLSPGMVVTEAHQERTKAKNLDEVRENFKVLQPMGRVAEVKEMAELIAFMISSQNSFMTGSIVVSDGGYTLK